MSKQWQVKAGLLLLSVCILFSITLVGSGLTQTDQPMGAKFVFSPVVKEYQADDNYEPNDDRMSAYDLSNNERTWLSTINGFGIQRDDDWFQIYVSSGNSHLNVELTFTHALGDIDISVHDSSGSFIDSSTGVQDNEDISVDVVPGTYYLRIYFEDAGNAYDLWWDDTVGGTTPPSPFSPLVIFIVVSVVAAVVIIIVIIVCVVVIVRRVSTPSRPPIRRTPSTRPTRTTKTISKPSPRPSGPTTKCPNCGSIIEPADKFCVGCGKPTDSS